MKNLLDAEREVLLKKASGKCPDLFDHDQAQIPDYTVIEQASSNLTAMYAASLFSPKCVLADLTAGLGINAFYFAKRVREVFAVERDKKRAQCLSHNLRLAEIDNVSVIIGDCVEWLRGPHPEFDSVFLDPSRRNSSSRIVKLSDCVPNVDDVLPLCPPDARVLIKASPLLDIKSVVNTLSCIESLHIVEVNREVKELLISLCPAIRIDITDIRLTCVRIFDPDNIQCHDFRLEDLSLNRNIQYLKNKCKLSSGGFLYEPSPAFMKSGMFGGLSSRFAGLEKFAPDSHLFFADHLFSDFPGRIFSIKSLLSSRDLKQLKGQRFNVVSRNHPVKAAELQSRFKFMPSDKDFIIASTVGREKVILSATKL